MTKSVELMDYLTIALHIPVLQDNLPINFTLFKQSSKDYKKQRDACTSLF
jgi:hypothetical protein